MEKYFKDFGISVSSKKDARRIRICKNLCQRLRDDCYTNPYEERNKPYHEWFRNSILRGRKVDKTTGLVKTVFDRENEPDDKWILSASEHEEYLADQDLELLGKLMKKHSRGWWD